MTTPGLVSSRRASNHICIYLRKPIQDALKGIVYANDETVIDVCSRKINLQQLPPFGVAPATLQAALSKPRGDFVFIRIADAHPQLEFS